MQKDEVLEIIKKLKNTYNSENEIFTLVSPIVNGNKKLLRQILVDLVNEGCLILSDRKKYALPERAGFIKGTLTCNPKGFGFVVPENKEIDDIFVAQRYLNGATHGDKVLARLINHGFFGKGKYGGKVKKQVFGESKEGEIVQILERKIKRIVGLFKTNIAGASVFPDDKRFAEEIFIDKKNTMGAVDNQKVVVEITSYPTRITMARGNVIEILGDVNDIGVDTLSIIRAYGLYEEFDKEVEDEAKKVAIEPTEKDIRGRKDFTKDLVITIDGDDARDFDDAISLKKNSKGQDVLAVHIADVSHYVKQGGIIDKSAFDRATSVYFPDHVLPMLPTTLSNGVCSLNPDVLRFTLSVEMILDERANVVDYEISRGVIKSRNRMTYNNVTKILSGDKEKRKEYIHLVPMLEEMEKLSNKMIKRLESKGNLDFDIPEVQIDMDENNKIKAIYRKPRTMSERMIEMFMIATNEVVAKHIKNLDFPCVYRIHEVPSAEKMHTFNDYVTGLGLPYTIPEVDPKPKDVQKVLKAIQGTDLEPVLATLLLRSMQKAEYNPSPIGHFGLALKDYCHFTSPIRRYPDLVVHRILKFAISKNFDAKILNFYENFVGPASSQSSERERLADEVEREVDNLKKAEYMLKFIGEKFDGVISGVVESGFFVSLENTIEGFVSVDDLPPDNYYFDEQKMCLNGGRNIFKIGDKVKIGVKGADLITRKVDFFFVEKYTKFREINKKH